MPYQIKNDFFLELHAYLNLLAWKARPISQTYRQVLREFETCQAYIRFLVSENAWNTCKRPRNIQFMLLATVCSDEFGEDLRSFGELLK